MRKYKLRNVRRKATFGIDGAVTAAAQLAATGLQIASDIRLAKEQQRAMKESAQLQADALKAQNENNNQLQEKSLQLIKSEKQRDRELQQDIQMNYQMQAARQNQRALEAANAIQVKNGGSARRKLRNVGMHSSLQAGKIPGIVTPHQGNYVPIAYTPNGILAMLTGPNHDNGGVDVDILGNKDIEAEGGELMHIKYALGGLAKRGLKDVQFISKHKLPGTNFNPKDAVMSGAMSPDEAFAAQERIKDIKGISDDGKTTPVKKNKKTAGGDYTTIQLPVELFSTLDDMNVRSLKCGGRVRTKFDSGGNYGGIFGSGSSTKLNKKYGRFAAPKNRWLYTNDADVLAQAANKAGILPANTTPIVSTLNSKSYPTNNSSDIIPDKQSNSGYNDEMTTARANIVGAGINAAGNVGSAVLSNIGNRIASRYLTRGYQQAGNTLIDAYRNLRTIDPSILSNIDFKSAAPLAAIQTPLATGIVENTLAGRQYYRSLRDIKRNSLSSAAARMRSNLMGSDYQDRVSQIQAGVNRINQGIIQSNMDRITDVSKTKLQFDTMANEKGLGTMLGLLQYNNDIVNSGIEGAAQTRADMINSIAGVKGSTSQQNWSNIGNTINAGANAFDSAFQTNAKMQNNLDYAMLGATDDSVIRWIDSNPDNTNARRYAKGIWRRYKNGSGQYRSIANRYQDYYGF